MVCDVITVAVSDGHNQMVDSHNSSFSSHRFMPNLVPPKIPDGERVDFDVSGDFSKQPHARAGCDSNPHPQAWWTWSLAKWKVTGVAGHSSGSSPHLPLLGPGPLQVCLPLFLEEGSLGLMGCIYRTSTGSGWRRT